MTKAQKFLQETKKYNYSTDLLKETGAELIEMETAGFYECMNAMEKKGIARLCVSDNSAADIALVMRDEESTMLYKTAREEYIPKLIDLICEM